MNLRELTLSHEQIKKLALEIEVLKDQLAGEVPDKVLEERKKIEQEANQSKDFMENVLEFCGDGIVIADCTARITRVNESFARILGREKEEIVGTLIYELWPTDGTFRSTTGETITLDQSYRDYIVKMTEKIFSLPGDDVKFENWEIYVRNKDGELVPLEMTMTIQKNAEGMVTGGVASVRDITKKKIAEKEIRESKEYLENIFKTTADGIMVTDNREMIIQFYEKGRICNWLQYYMNKDHKLVPCNHNAIFLSNDKGERTIAFSIIRDLTEQKKAVRAIEEANRCRSQFFTNISHEFRTPLTLAMGPIEEIIRNGNGKSNGNLKKQLSLSLRNSRKLLKLINQLLEFSRLDSGSQHLIYEKKNLKEFIAAILDSFSFIAKNKKIHLTFDTSGNTNGAYIDPVKMEKVLFNLIGNAFKFTPEGGSIKVGITGKHGSDDKGNDQVTISVEDTGIGIQEESLPRIFERFHQANGGFNRKYEGSGIGLALSKELVELMGGTIEATSEYGKGTALSVCIPVGKEQIKEGSCRGNGSGVVLSHQAEIELSDLDCGNGNGGRMLEDSIRGDNPLILIVDDNPDVRSYVSDIVKKEYDYITARNGEEGLKKLEEYQPDMILCDVMMPGMDGHEFLTQVKATPRLKETPFIFLTARAGSEMKIEGLEEGADDYVVKPFNSLELLARIKSLLRIRTLKRRNTAQKKEISSLTQKLQKRYGYDTIVGNSPPMRKVYQMLESVSDSELTVLIMGETGTGKELIANALHYNSPRKDGPFIAVNCGAIPKELMEREFFGHVKGAYTGAHQDRKGYFEKANGGTLFLDEIGELDKSLQVKLLRVLERGEVTRVGTTEPTRIDVRLVAATNKDLRTEVKEGNFREDLYYRIYVLPVQVPPLRERREDIPLLVEHFIESFQSESNTEVPSLSEKEMNLLMHYSYPGNVRELEHVIERHCLLGSSAGNLFNDLSETSGNLTPAIFYDEILSSASPLKKAREHTERDIITHALTICDNDYGVTAKKLNICLASLYKKVKEYGVNQ